MSLCGTCAYACDLAKPLPASMTLQHPRITPSGSHQREFTAGHKRFRSEHSSPEKQELLLFFVSYVRAVCSVHSVRFTLCTLCTLCTQRARYAQYVLAQRDRELFQWERHKHNVRSAQRTRLVFAVNTVHGEAGRGGRDGGKMHSCCDHNANGTHTKEKPKNGLHSPQDKGFFSGWSEPEKKASRSRPLAAEFW